MNSILFSSSIGSSLWDRVHHEPHVLDAGVDVGLDLLDVADLLFPPVAGITCITPMAPTRLLAS